MQRYAENFLILKGQTMYKEKLSGVFVPAITPFANDEILFDRLTDNIKKFNQTQIRGYLALGSNGENKSLTMDEKLKVLEVFVKNKGDKVIMAGTGCESTNGNSKFQQGSNQDWSGFRKCPDSELFCKTNKG